MGSLDELLYGESMQITVVIPDEQMDVIDKLVPSNYRSRAEVVRVALDDLLRAHRRQVIDDQYIAALEAAGGDDSVGGLRKGDVEPAAWTDVPW